MSPDWLGASRRAAAALRTMLAERATIAERVIETGTRGEGGDRTLEIDALAEEAVLAELAAPVRRRRALHRRSARSAGRSTSAATALLVVVDPIDGSLNAKRGLPHHCVSIAVAEGPTMADVVFGFVQDFGPDEEWVAHARRRRDAQRRAARSRASASGAGRRTASSSSSASSRPTRAGCCSRPRGSSQVAHRLRAIGTIAAAHVPGRGRALRRDAHAQGLPGGRRGRRAADRARGRRSRRLHGVRGPARPRRSTCCRTRPWWPRAPRPDWPNCAGRAILG